MQCYFVFNPLLCLIFDQSNHSRRKLKGLMMQDFTQIYSLLLKFRLNFTQISP